MVFGLTWILLCVGGRAQSTSGTILGTITDTTGSVLPDAPVTLTDIATAESRETRSNASGFYQFVNVPPGSYRVKAVKDGFNSATREPINLQVEGSIQIDIKMKIGPANQQIVVTEETPLVQAETSSLGTVIDQRETTEMPLNGRNPMSLAALVPGVVPQGQSTQNPTGTNIFAWGNYQIGGGMANQSITLLDGALLNSANSHLQVLVPTQDSLQEFKVDTNNLSSEYGRFAGGAINFRTKSGSNELHGGAWEFLRNKVLNANTYFGNQAGLPNPAFTQNQYGFNVGGPVVIPHLYDGHRRTFFFVNWEGFALREGETFTETVPTAAERTGNLQDLGTAIYDPGTTCGVSPGVPCQPGQQLYDRTAFANATIPGGRLNATAVAYLNAFYPQPNVNTTTVQNNFIRNAATGGNNYQTVARIDHAFSDAHHLSGRYTYWTNNNLPIDPYGTGICQDRCGESFNTNSFSLEDTYAFNPTTIMDINISYLRFVYTRSALLNNYNVTTLNMPAALAAEVQFRTPPLMSISGYDIDGTFASQGGGSTIREYNDGDRIAGSITKFLGNHTLKFGGEFWRGTQNYVQNQAAAGYFSFNNSFTSQNPLTGVDGEGLASFLLGYAQSGSASYSNAIASTEYYPAAYLNDDWRATRKLTVHAGMRWETDLPFTERFNRMDYFDPSAINPLLASAGITQYHGSPELVASSTRSSRSNINNDWKQVSPRIGASYQVAPNTVLSAGYGIFWPPPDASCSDASCDDINSFNTPYTASTNNGLTPANNISNPFPGGITPAPGRNPVYNSYLLGTTLSESIPTNPYTYAQQWNAALQQQFGKRFAMTLAYAGAKGTHLLFGDLPIDQLPDSQLALGNPLNNQVTNPFYGVVNPNYSIGTPTVAAGQLLLPYPQYTGVNDVAAGWAASTYNALQLSVQERLPHGASINGAYTFAKLLSNTVTLTYWLESAAAGIQDANNLQGEKSLSSQDVHQRLVISYVYDLPIGRGLAYLSDIPRALDEAIGGWGAEGITTFQSGFPLGFTTNENLTNSFGGGSRPNYVAGCSKQTSGSAVSRLNGWFNASCFTQPAAFTFGNEARNDATLRSPGIANWDAALFKNFPLDNEGRVKLQFRAEAFNLFNRVQFGYPGLVQGSSNFAEISSQANQPRILQFALRLSF